MRISYRVNWSKKTLTYSLRRGVKATRVNRQRLMMHSLAY